MKPGQPEPPILKLRVGIDVPEWIGMLSKEPQLNIPRDLSKRIEALPQSVPSHAFAHLENVRHLGGRVVSRAGQAKVNGDPVDGCVEGLFDAGDIGAPEGGDAAPGILILGASLTGTLGRTIFLDEDFVVSDTTVEDRPELATNHAGAAWIGLRTSSGGETASFYRYPSGDSFQLPSEVVPPLVSTPALVSMASAGSDLYVLWDLFVVDPDLGVNTDHWTISRWNDAELSEELVDTSSLGGIRKLGTLASSPYALGWHYDSGGAPLFQIVLRRNGPADWDEAFTLPDEGGDPTTDAVFVNGGEWLEFNGRLYMFAFDTLAGSGNSGLVIYSTAGSDGTISRVVDLLVLYSFNIQLYAQAAVVDTTLYFAYWATDTVSPGPASPGAPVTLVIGSYDGATWTDVLKDLTDDITLGDYVQCCGFVAGPDGANAVLLKADGVFDIWGSPGTDLTGTWTKVFSYDSTEGGEAVPGTYQVLRVT